MAVCSTTALRKYLTQRSNLGQPLREKAGSTTRGHAEGETLITSGAYRRPLFKSSQSLVNMGRWIGGRAEISGLGRRAWIAFHRPDVTWQAALQIAAQALGTIRVWNG